MAQEVSLVQVLRPTTLALNLNLEVSLDPNLNLMVQAVSLDPNQGVSLDLIHATLDLDLNLNLMAQEVSLVLRSTTLALNLALNLDHKLPVLPVLLLPALQLMLPVPLSQRLQ
jgi:hypothetical protein